MVRRSLLVVSLLAVCCTVQAQAGIFRRTPKSSPTDQVGEQVKSLRTDPDERKRATAAEELGKADAKTYPAAHATLIEALLKDSSPGVRHEAAQSLGKMRPLTNQAAAALEHALNNDVSTRVRMTARASLVQYHTAGYRGANPANATPSVANPPAPQPRTAATTSRPGVRTTPVRETPEPPLATIHPTQPPRPLNPAVIPRPATVIKPAPTPRPTTPVAPVEIKPEPVKPTKPAPPKPAKPDDDGPILIPPG